MNYDTEMGMFYIIVDGEKVWLYGSNAIVMLCG